MGPLVLLKTINILVHLCLAGQSFAWPRKTLVDTGLHTNSERLSKGQSPSELIEMGSISVLCYYALTRYLGPFYFTIEEMRN